MKKVILILALTMIMPAFAQEEVSLDLSLPEVHKIDTGSLQYENRKMDNDEIEDVDASFSGIKSMFLEDVISDELKDMKYNKRKKK